MSKKSTQPRSKRQSPTKAPKLSRTQAPPETSLVEWQRKLRQQFGSEQVFGIENIGSEPVFSEFRVTNSQSRSSYRVAIRGLKPGDNYCACADYATNALGTCKHVEFVLALLSKKRGAKAAFARGFHPPFSELYWRHDGGPQAAAAATRSGSTTGRCLFTAIGRASKSEMMWRVISCMGAVAQ